MASYSNPFYRPVQAYTPAGQEFSGLAQAIASMATSGMGDAGDLARIAEARRMNDAQIRRYAQQADLERQKLDMERTLTQAQIGKYDAERDDLSSKAGMNRSLVDAVMRGDKRAAMAYSAGTGKTDGIQRLFDGFMAENPSAVSDDAIVRQNAIFGRALNKDQAVSLAGQQRIRDENAQNDLRKVYMEQAMRAQAEAAKPVSVSEGQDVYLPSGQVLRGSRTLSQMQAALYPQAMAQMAGTASPEDFALVAQGHAPVRPHQAAQKVGADDLVDIELGAFDQVPGLSGLTDPKQRDAAVRQALESVPAAARQQAVQRAAAEYERTRDMARAQQVYRQSIGIGQNTSVGRGMLGFGGYRLDNLGQPAAPAGGPRAGQTVQIGGQAARVVGSSGGKTVVEDAQGRRYIVE